MARQLNAVPNIDAPDGDYPAGKIRNNNPPTDGTPVIEELYGDIIQFFHKLMRLAGLAYNDLSENESDGFQFISSLATYVRTLSATDTIKGTVEIATNAETQAGADPSRVVTPAGLESKTATETRQGIAETATTAEAQARSDDSRIMTSRKTSYATRNGNHNITSNNEAYTVAAGIGVVVNNGYSGVAITLPPHVSGLKQEVIIVNNYTTGSGGATEVDDGGTPLDLISQKIYRFISDGTNWHYTSNDEFQL